MISISHRGYRGGGKKVDHFKSCLPKNVSIAQSLWVIKPQKYLKSVKLPGDFWTFSDPGV